MSDGVAARIRREMPVPAALIVPIIAAEAESTISFGQGDFNQGNPSNLGKAFVILSAAKDLVEHTVMQDPSLRSG